MASKTKLHKLKREMQRKHRRFRTVADWINKSGESSKKIKLHTLRAAYECWSSFKSAAKSYTINELGRKKSKIKTKNEGST